MGRGARRDLVMGQGTFSTSSLDLQRAEVREGFVARSFLFDQKYDKQHVCAGSSVIRNVGRV